jgi:hypothetical protein
MQFLLPNEIYRCRFGTRIVPAVSIDYASQSVTCLTPVMPSPANLPFRLLIGTTGESVYGDNAGDFEFYGMQIYCFFFFKKKIVFLVGDQLDTLLM